MTHLLIALAVTFATPVLDMNSYDLCWERPAQAAADSPTKRAFQERFGPKASYDWSGNVVLHCDSFSVNEITY